MDARYTPIGNHVHAIEAVMSHCKVHHLIELIPTNPFRVDLEATPPRPGFATLKEANPLLTVPSMKNDKGQPVYGGPVIYEYLDSLRAQGTKSLFETAEPLATRRQLWLADGIFDTFVRLLLESLQDSPRENDAKRLWTKILNALDALNSDAGKWHAHGFKADLDIAQIRAVAVLDFVGNRPEPGQCAGAPKDWSWRTGRDDLAAWFDVTSKLHIFSQKAADLC